MAAKFVRVTNLKAGRSKDSKVITKYTAGVGQHRYVNIDRIVEIHKMDPDLHLIEGGCVWQVLSTGDFFCLVSEEDLNKIVDHDRIKAPADVSKEIAELVRKAGPVGGPYFIPGKVEDGFGVVNQRISTEVIGDMLGIMKTLARQTETACRLEMHSKGVEAEAVRPFVNIGLLATGFLDRVGDRLEELAPGSIVVMPAQDEIEAPPKAQEVIDCFMQDFYPALQLHARHYRGRGWSLAYNARDHFSGDMRSLELRGHPDRRRPDPDKVHRISVFISETYFDPGKPDRIRNFAGFESDAFDKVISRDAALSTVDNGLTRAADVMLAGPAGKTADDA